MILNRRYAKIRVDASSQIGLGHLIRCISLAHMIKEDFKACFYLLEPSDSILNIIENEGFDLIHIEEEDDYLNDLAHEDLAILDGYHFQTVYQKRIKEKGSFLVCIDDLHNQHFVADLVINHAPGLTEDDYSKEDHTLLALGPQYAMLRPEFLRRSIFHQERKGVFVCLGGADPLNLTQKVLDSLFKTHGQISASLVLGAANDKLTVISDWARENAFDLKIYQGLSAQAMSELMNSCKYAIVPSSGILMESLATGLIPLIGYFVDNQMRMFHNWKSLGLFALGDMREREAFEKHLSEFNFNQQNQSREASGLLDGKSGSRLLDIILNGFSKR